MEIPENLMYSKEHEWINEVDEIATIGITDFAQDSLGDIVFIELPEVGDEVKTGDSVGVVESVKSVSDIYAPVTGEIIEVNGLLEDEPEKINESPYKDGWIFKIKTTAEPDLIDSEEYAEYIKG